MKILIATPVYNNLLDSRMVSSFLGVLKECQKRNVSMDWDRPCSPMLSYNRNISAHRAIQEGFDWLLYWDADTSVTESDFPFKMIETAYEKEAQIVGLPCRLKVPYKKWNCAFKEKKGYVNLEGELPLIPFKIDVIGTGVMLIKVDAVKDMQAPFFSVIDTTNDTPGGKRAGFFPEDWTFCEKATKKGYKVMADPQFTVQHWGSYSYE